MSNLIYNPMIKAVSIFFLSNQAIPMPAWKTSPFSRKDWSGLDTQESNLFDAVTWSNLTSRPNNLL